MADMPNIPNLPAKVDPSIRQAFAAVRAWFNAMGKLISDSELTGTGAFTRMSDGRLIANIQTLDMTVPPQVAGLTTTGSMGSILLSWVPPEFLPLARVEIWRSDTDDVNTAGMVGTTGSTGFLDTPEGATTASVYYYWVRIVSAAGVLGPFNDVAGTPGSISDNSSYILDVLNGQITPAELGAELTSQLEAHDSHLTNTANPHETTLDKATEAGANSTRLFSCGEKVAFTPEGGLAVKLTNKTGSASVKGTVVTTGTAVDNSFAVQTAEFEAAGIVYESGVADGAECWVVVSGIAEVLMKDGVAPVRGDWCKCADTDGRAEATVPPTGIGALSTAEHFKEIGHCLESKDAGANVLAKVVLHFN